jgi:hydroxypyruvate reductase
LPVNHLVAMSRVSEPVDVLVRLRAEARAIAAAGVEAVDAGRRLRPALEAWLQARPGRGGVRVIAAGKAAGVMMRTAIEAGLMVERGLIASTHWRGDWPASITTFEAGHPIPTDASEAAGRAALDLARGAAVDEALIVLLSGGASALLCAPADGTTLADKQATTKLLLEAGASIDELNAVRKHLSALKGGGLAAAARCEVVTFALSDVVGPIADDPGVIGSGPTSPDASTWSDALDVVTRRGVLARLPAAVRARLESGARSEIAETPKPGDPRLARATWHLIGSRVDAMDAARNAAIDRGFSTITIEAPVVGQARDAGPSFVARALEVSRRLPRPVCVVGAGETTVRVVGRGRGGRNQEMALAAAGALATLREPAAFLSTGTDGIDGPTDAAGGLVDTTTRARAHAAGVDLDASLADNDAYHALDRLGDLVRTGPTDTNVGDLQVLVIGDLERPAP